jgi:hypothetical protein
MAAGRIVDVTVGWNVDADDGPQVTRISLADFRCGSPGQLIAEKNGSAAGGAAGSSGNCAAIAGPGDSPEPDPR